MIPPGEDERILLPYSRADQVALPGRYKILFASGYWWFSDPFLMRMIRLNPLFEKARWRVDALCRLLGLGQRTFTRCVQVSLGINCKLWLQTERMVIACHLLREGSKISHVANRMGFRHASDFALEFRKLVGVSPSCYVLSEGSRSQPEESGR